MREQYADLWSFYGKPGFVVCITTNGFVKRNGSAVMGAGCALQAKKKFPGLDEILGREIERAGNIFRPIVMSDLGGSANICAFPVKHHWKDKADLDLIRRSAAALADFARSHPTLTFVLPRPGCGNGRLLWADVKPAIEALLPDNVVVVSFSEAEEALAAKEKFYR